MKIAFDTSAWRALGIKGCKSLADHFRGASPASVDIWETVPVLFETTWDWMKDGKPHVAAEMAKLKLVLCGGRIVPSPKAVVQRAIADHFGLPRPPIDEEVRIYHALLQRMTDSAFLVSKDFQETLLSSVKIAREGYAQAMEELAKALSESLGGLERTPGLIELLFAKPEVRSAMAQALIYRFDLPPHMRSRMAMFSSWQEVEHTRRVLEYYSARLEARLVGGILARPQDFLDFEVAICGTRLDRLVTENTNDFQKYDLPSMRDRLWTLNEFKSHIGLVEKQS